MTEDDKKEIVFIVNPISGNSKKSNLPQLIKNELDASIWDWKIEYTQYAGHATELAKSLADKKVDVIVAVGGDGTINEVVSGIYGSDSTMGIIPLGSGNGFARHLGIPMNTRKAIQLLNKYHVIHSDVFSLNGRKFINVSGIGFDGKISELFNQSKGRGFLSYARTFILEVNNYKASHFTILMGNKKIEVKALFISFCNSSQFGNNAQIAPTSSVNDGKVEIVCVKPLPFFRIPHLLYRVFSGLLYNSNYVDHYSAREVIVNTVAPTEIHVDGEFYGRDDEVKVSLMPLQIRVFGQGQTYLHKKKS